MREQHARLLTLADTFLVVWNLHSFRKISPRTLD